MVLKATADPTTASASGSERLGPDTRSLPRHCALRGEDGDPRARPPRAGPATTHRVQVTLSRSQPDSGSQLGPMRGCGGRPRRLHWAREVRARASPEPPLVVRQGANHPYHSQRDTWLRWWWWGSAVSPSLTCGRALAARAIPFGGSGSSDPHTRDGLRAPDKRRTSGQADWIVSGATKIFSAGSTKGGAEGPGLRARAWTAWYPLLRSFTGRRGLRAAEPVQPPGLVSAPRERGGGARARGPGAMRRRRLTRARPESGAGLNRPRCLAGRRPPDSRG